MNRRIITSLSVVALGAAIVLGAVPAAAQSDPPQTPWGKPDLMGVWDFRSITPMQRPEDLVDQEFLTEEEVANREQEAVDREIRLFNRAAQRTVAGANVDRGTEGAPGSYNNFWLDRGTNYVGTRRTSLIIDPPDGRYPPMTEDGERRAAHTLEERSKADWTTNFSSGVRCILGFNAGPPMNPSAYNNNMQLFQTPDTVVIVTEMVQTARVVPLRRTSRARLGHSPMVGRFARPLGWRHTRHRDDELRRQAEVAKHDQRHASDRAADAGRCGDARLRVYGRRPRDLDGLVDRRGADAA